MPITINNKEYNPAYITVSNHSYTLWSASKDDPPILVDEDGDIVVYSEPGVKQYLYLTREGILVSRYENKNPRSWKPYTKKLTDFEARSADLAYKLWDQIYKKSK